jgi:hypothetical protein
MRVLPQLRHVGLLDQEPSQADVARYQGVRSLRQQPDGRLLLRMGRQQACGRSIGVFESGHVHRTSNRFGI